MDKENYYSDDYAMRYEYLIRRAHKCGRHGVGGADADIYRRFLRNAITYKTEKELIDNNKPRQWNKSEQEMIGDYMKCAGEVSAHITTSTELVKRKYDGKLTDEQYQELEKAEMLLLKPNVENIAKSINMAEKVMLELKLFPE